MAELTTHCGSGVGMGHTLISSTRAGLWAIQMTREKGSGLMGHFRHLLSFDRPCILLFLVSPRRLEYQFYVTQ